MPQAKECLGLPEAGNNKQGSSCRDFKESRALLAPSVLTSSLQFCEILNLCHFKPPTLSYVAIAVL